MTPTNDHAASFFQWRWANAATRRGSYLLDSWIACNILYWQIRMDCTAHSPQWNRQCHRGAANLAIVVLYLIYIVIWSACNKIITLDIIVASTNGKKTVFSLISRLWWNFNRFNVNWISHHHRSLLSRCWTLDWDRRKYCDGPFDKTPSQGWYADCLAQHQKWAQERRRTFDRLQGLMWPACPTLFTKLITAWTQVHRIVKHHAVRTVMHSFHLDECDKILLRDGRLVCFFFSHFSSCCACPSTSYRTCMRSGHCRQWS